MCFNSLFFFFCSTRKLEIHIAFLSEKYEADIGKVISKFEGI